MAIWTEILTQMEDNTEYTAAKLGVYSATMTALVNRGYVTKTTKKPLTYIKQNKAKNYLKIWDYINNRPKQESYSFLKENETLGMYCTIKGNDILDCRDNIYDVENVTKVIYWENGIKYIKNL